MNDSPARKLRISHVSVAAAVPQTTMKKWLEDGTQKLEAPQTDGWKAFNIQDGLVTAALAEVSRAGFDPKRATELWSCLAEGLHELERNGGVVKKKYQEGALAVGEVFGPPDSPAGKTVGVVGEINNAFILTPSEFAKILATPEQQMFRATTHVSINIVGVWKRFHSRLAFALAIESDK